MPSSPLAAVRAALALPASVHAYSSPVAVWIEAPAIPALPAPAQWSAKRGEWYVDVRRGLPAVERRPVLELVRSAPAKAPAKKRASRKVEAVPAGGFGTGGGWDVDAELLRDLKTSSGGRVGAQLATNAHADRIARERAQGTAFRKELRQATASPTFRLRLAGLDALNHAKLTKLQAAGIRPEQITMSAEHGPDMAVPAELLAA